MSLSDLEKRRRDKLDRLWNFVMDKVADEDELRGKISYIEGKAGGGTVTFSCLGERWTLDLYPEADA